MKRIFPILLLISTAMCTSLSITADDSNSASVILSQDPEPDFPIDQIPSRHRIPSRPIVCTINTEGISIEGMDMDEISLYEAYDLDGLFLFSTSDMLDFAFFVLTSTSDMEIRLHTAEFFLNGFLLH